METATENKLTHDEQERLIRLLTNKANDFEIETVKQGIEIEGLKQKNIVITDKLQSKTIDCITWEHKYNRASEKGNEAIAELETARYWMWIREAAMAITIIGFIVYHLIK